MKIKGRVKLLRTGVARTAGFAVRGISQARAEAADSNSMGRSHSRRLPCLGAIRTNCRFQPN